MTSQGTDEESNDYLLRFVTPHMVTLLEENDASALQKTQREVAILFVDIEGCSTLCEHLPPEEMNELIEFYFSHFFDVIQEFGGTVNEIMGDGFMAIFERKDPEDNIRDAAAAAVGIGGMVSRLKGQRSRDHYDTQVHIGVHAGNALVGFTKFRAKRWERWTYTASGPVTNIAARLCQLALGGSILVSGEVAAVVRSRYSLEHMGAQKLKNVSQPVNVYELRN
jgi:class 3 adenylate cyclase